jgi:hypothetical protein
MKKVPLFRGQKRLINHPLNCTAVLHLVLRDPHVPGAPRHTHVPRAL